MTPARASSIGEARDRHRPHRASGRDVACRLLATDAPWCDDRRVSRTGALDRLSSLAGVGPAIALLAVGLLALLGWAPHLPDSLWLDETLTAWVVGDGLGDAIHRSLHYQPQPGYFVFVWLWTRVAGASEVALRLPSLLAALAACVALARLGTLLTRDRETGWLAAVVLASSWNLFRESVDARSYMLGLLAAIGLAIALVRWLDAGRWRAAWAIGLLGATLPHLHLFFALIYPAFGAYAWLRWPVGGRDRRQVALVGGLLALGALLFLPVARMIVEQGGAYSFVPPPAWRSLFEVWAWGPPVAGLLFGLGVTGLMPRGAEGAEAAVPPADPAPAIRRESRVLIGVWLLLPLFLLFAVSMATDANVFLGRYLIPAIPAVALVYAMALRAIPSARARVAAVAVVVLAAFVSHERPPDDFRGAAAAVSDWVGEDASVPVLFASGLVEGEDERWLRDPQRAAYLNSPATVYPIAGRLIAIPRRISGHPLGAGIVDPVLRDARRFAAIEWFGNGARVLPWLVQRAEAAGYRVERRGFGGVRVAFFDAPRGKTRRSRAR